MGGLNSSLLGFLEGAEHTFVKSEGKSELLVFSNLPSASVCMGDNLSV